MTETPEKWKAAPYFVVPDITRAVEYYRDRLGFSVDDWGNFAMVNRGGATIMLNQLKLGQMYPELINPNQKADHHAWDAYIWIHQHNLDELYTELKERGATIHHEPTKKTEYGMYEFEVVDPFGYVICFGQDLDD